MVIEGELKENLIFFVNKYGLPFFEKQTMDRRLVAKSLGML